MLNAYGVPGFELGSVPYRGKTAFNLHTQTETVTKALKEEAGSGLRVAGREAGAVRAARWC